MIYVAYLLPVATTAIAAVVRGDFADQWFAYLASTLVADGLIWLLYYFLTRSTEYLSGYVVGVVHHFAWVERVVRYETVTVNGKSQSVRREEHVYHPDVWFRLLNTGRSESVNASYFDEMCSLWSTGRYGIAVHHPNQISGGGGEQSDWDGIEDHSDTSTYTHRYRNPLRNSNSIFLGSKITRKQARQMGLFKYPSTHTYADQQVVLCHKDATPLLYLHEANRSLQFFNAFKGSSSQIHAFIIIFPASLGIEIARRQRDYWHGLNKNELLVCLGMDGGHVAWCHTQSWMDSPVLDTTYRDYFAHHPDLATADHPDLPSLCDFIDFMSLHLNLWQRKEFSDFRYLGTHFSTGASAVYWIISIALSVAILLIALT